MGLLRLEHAVACSVVVPKRALVQSKQNRRSPLGTTTLYTTFLGFFFAHAKKSIIVETVSNRAGFLRGIFETETAKRLWDSIFIQPEAVSLFMAENNRKNQRVFYLVVKCI
jgi:hypothetical protein